MKNGAKPLIYNNLAPFIQKQCQGDAFKFDAKVKNFCKNILFSQKTDVYLH